MEPASSSGERAEMTRLSDKEPGDPLTNALCLQIEAYKADEVELGDSLKATINLLIQAEREQLHSRVRLKRGESSGSPTWGGPLAVSTPKKAKLSCPRQPGSGAANPKQPSEQDEPELQQTSEPAKPTQPPEQPEDAAQPTSQKGSVTAERSEELPQATSDEAPTGPSGEDTQEEVAECPVRVRTHDYDGLVQRLGQETATRLGLHEREERLHKYENRASGRHAIGATVVFFRKPQSEPLKLPSQKETRLLLVKNMETGRDVFTGVVIPQEMKEGLQVVVYEVPGENVQEEVEAVISKLCRSIRRSLVLRNLRVAARPAFLNGALGAWFVSQLARLMRAMQTCGDRAILHISIEGRDGDVPVEGEEAVVTDELPETREPAETHEPAETREPVETHQPVETHEPVEDDRAWGPEDSTEAAMAEMSFDDKSEEEQQRGDDETQAAAAGEGAEEESGEEPARRSLRSILGLSDEEWENHSYTHDCKDWLAEEHPGVFARLESLLGAYGYMARCNRTRATTVYVNTRLVNFCRNNGGRVHSGGDSATFVVNLLTGDIRQTCHSKECRGEDGRTRFISEPIVIDAEGKETAAGGNDA